MQVGRYTSGSLEGLTTGVLHESWQLLPPLCVLQSANVVTSSCNLWQVQRASGHSRSFLNRWFKGRPLYHHSACWNNFSSLCSKSRNMRESYDVLSTLSSQVGVVPRVCVYVHEWVFNRRTLTVAREGFLKPIDVWLKQCVSGAAVQMCVEAHAKRGEAPCSALICNVCLRPLWWVLPVTTPSKYFWQLLWPYSAAVT